MSKVWVIQNKKTNQFLHITEGNIPTSKDNVEWVINVNDATHFPGRAYVDYAFKQFRLFVNEYLAISIKHVDIP